jgi:hypothetical protein
MSRYPLFDRKSLKLAPLSERGHELTPDRCAALAPPAGPYAHREFGALVDAIVDARAADRPVIWMMGAHPIKLGLNRFLIDLIERGWITHLATNGAGLIHDYELAWGQGTSEDVPRWIGRGQFGLWHETGRLNDIVREAARVGEGLGEAVGRVIEQQRFPCRDLSLAAAGWRVGIPVTSHVSIGSDIIHAHANCDGAALGQASLIDFLIFARAVQALEGGVFLNVGTAVTGPEVYLKALSMARNVAHQRGESITRFTTAVWDLVPLPETFRHGPPSKEHPLYYYRPWKTILVRTVADGGRSFYFCGNHQQTIPSLWQQLVTRAVSAPKVRAA